MELWKRRESAKRSEAVNNYTIIIPHRINEKSLTVKCASTHKSLYCEITSRGKSSLERGEVDTRAGVVCEPRVYRKYDDARLAINSLCMATVDMQFKPGRE